ncbi:hypothetical protein ACOMHN_026276 [Nucella lapillus]
MNVYPGTVLALFIFLHILNLTQSQPTVQNFFWRNPQISRGCSNNKDGRSSHQHGKVRLSSSPGLSSLQNSLDMVLLELQRHAVDTETLRENVHSLHERHEHSMRLLAQLTESVNILVKTLVKTPGGPCDCDRDADERRGGYGRQRGGGAGGRGGEGGEGSNVNDRDFHPEDEYVQLFDSSVSHPDDSAAEESSTRDQGLVMDQKKTRTLTPHISDKLPGHVHEMPRDLEVNQSRADTRDQNGDPSMAGGSTTSSDATTTTGTTTTTPDPILLMYNGSVPKE